MDEIRFRLFRQMAVFLTGLLAPVVTVFLNRYVLGHVRAFAVRAFYAVASFVVWVAKNVVWKSLTVTVTVIAIVGEYVVVGFVVSYGLSEGIFYLLCLYDNTYGLHNSSMAHYLYHFAYSRAAIVTEPVVHAMSTGFATLVDVVANSSHIFTHATGSVIEMVQHVFRS